MVSSPQISINCSVASSDQVTARWVLQGVSGSTKEEDAILELLLLLSTRLCEIRKFGHGTPKKQAGTTYSRGPGPETFLGTRTRHISIYTAKIEGAGP